MGVVDAFWAGAQRWARSVDVVGLAAAAGGADCLARCTEADLVGLGVDRAIAHKWMATRESRSRATTLTLADPRYPRRLRCLPCAPPVLHVEGCMEVLKAKKSVAIVGTRACTAHGAVLARRLGSALAERNVLVVSGLARGIDAAAHTGAAPWGLTVAVLAHGLDHQAPPSNRRLRREFLDAGGACLTTWPDSTGPLPWRFPQRNAWIAGLSDVVVVVEAGNRSGARHTAMAAVEFGRDLYVVPGRIGDSASRGCNRLLAEGANPLHDVTQFVRDMGFCASQPADWLEQLFSGASLEQVSRATGESVVQLMQKLARLELEGTVVRVPGQRYVPGGGK
jgi:DNA processing protein